jgi:DNA invertase Pin-like site-specific DNA recombinase
VSSPRPILHCAIYTRKSSEEGLEQGFNSLDAQREACEAFIKSQHHEGWRVLPAQYDDGGYSGGTIERPALQRLLEDIDKRRVQVVVVYKVDRLTRALADFAKIVERFDGSGVSFVSVTQQFNTTSSMGRLTLNVLLSFAQFEREVTGERIMDNIAASKKKGMWMGGRPPIGYVGQERTLAIEEEGAAIIRHIFQSYLKLGCVRLLQQALHRSSITTPHRQTAAGNAYGGKPFSRGHLYKILRNPVYTGQIVHRGKAFTGQHPPIIDSVQWEAVQTQLDTQRHRHRQRASTPSDSLLKGLLYDSQGRRLIPSHSQKRSKRYRYYISEALVAGTRQEIQSGLRLPAQEIESLVIAELHNWLGEPASVLDHEYSDPAMAQQVLVCAQQSVAELRSGSDAAYRLAHRLVQRVVVESDVVRIQISPHRLRQEVASDEKDSRPVELMVPVQLRRCGLAMRLVIQGKEHQVMQVTDHAMIQSISTAHDWLKQLTSGKHSSVLSLAEAEGKDASYVTKVLYRAFLAPDIVEAILAGNQPPTLTQETLKKSLPLPIDWNEQRKLLGSHS